MSAEIDAIKAYMLSTGVPHKVTSTTGGQHATHSYHYRGLAVDLAGLVPSVDSPALMSIFNAFVPIEKQLAELIYARAPYNIKHGKHVGLYATPIHHNHVHVAVEAGWRWTATTTSKPAPSTNVVFSLPCSSGGYWDLKADGSIYAYEGAPYKGGANTQPYFVGRVAERLEPLGGGYTIVATSGERYDYP